LGQKGDKTNKYQRKRIANFKPVFIIHSYI